MSSTELDYDITDTLEKSKKRLDNIEEQLGKRFNITCNIREQLVEMDKNNLLVEDRLVADWVSELACYLDWLENPGD